MSWLPRNVRGRLALGYAAAVAATVLIYAAVVYGFMRSSLLDQLDARLHDDYERVEHAFEIDAEGGLGWKDLRPPGYAHATPEAPWTEVTHPRGGPSLRYPPQPAAGGAPYRTYERSHVVGGEAYRIRVGRSLGPLEDELAALLGLLSLCLLPVVALAWLGGRVLARRALAPVDAMTERARHIGAERLSERLPVQNPEDELGRLATVFNDAFARLERSFDRLRRFTSDAAHELRTPLAALRAVGEVGLAREGGPDPREVIASMLEETERLTRLVEQLLELARADARSAPLPAETFDLVALAREVCERLEVLAAERGQTLEVHGGSDVGVVANAASMRAALTGLVDNAIRHGPPDAPVRVEVSADATGASVRVRDRGPGIAPEHRGRVFERFYRVEASRAGGGTGLGLSLARRAVEAAGGRLDLEEAAGETCFRIVLPGGARVAGAHSPMRPRSRKDT